MADTCLFCRKTVYKKEMCEEHYNEYEKVKDKIIFEERDKKDFKHTFLDFI